MEALVPNPVSVAITLAVCDQFLERHLRDEPIANEVVRLRRPPIANPAISNHDVVPFVDETEGEAEAGVVNRGDDESHARREKGRKASRRSC